jgi:hypothetical protein
VIDASKTVQFETDSDAPLFSVAFPPTSASVPLPLILPLRLAVPESVNVSPFETVTVAPAPSVKLPG